MAITWRTVLGNMSPAEASRPLQAATQTLDNAFNRLGQMVTDQQGVAQAAVDRGDESKVLAFKEALAAARSPEEVAKLQAQRDQYLGGIQNKFRSQLVGAEEARITGLMDNLTKQYAFEDAKVTREQRPIVDQIGAHYARGEFDAGDALVQANPGLRGLANLAKERAVTQRSLEEQGWKRDDAGWKKIQHEQEQKLFPLREQQLRTNISAQQAQIAAATDNRELARMQRDQLRAGAQAEARTRLLRESGNQYAVDGVFTPDKQGELFKLMKDQGVGDSDGERRAVIERLAKFRHKVPVEQDDGTVIQTEVPLPYSLVKGIVGGSKDQVFNWWNQGWANNIEGRLKQALAETTMTTDVVSGKPVAADRLVKDLQEYYGSRRDAAENPVVTPPKRGR